MFAESFTGYPVRILVPTSTSEHEIIQTEGAIKIYVPSEVKPKILTQDDREIAEENLALSVYKGLISLQASAALYKGVPEKQKLREYASSLGSEEAGTLDEILIRADRVGMHLNCFNIFELSRRMQCIESDYRVLGEDMGEGFSSIFQPNSIYKAGKSKYETRDGIKADTDELDLVLSLTYWRNLGVSDERLQEIAKNVPRDACVGEYRDTLYEIVFGLSRFSNPLQTSWEDSLKRVLVLREYVVDLMRDLDLPNAFYWFSPKTEVGGGFSDPTKDKLEIEATRGKIASRKEKLTAILTALDGEEKNLPLGLDSRERIAQRLIDLLTLESSSLRASENTRLSVVLRSLGNHIEAFLT